MGFGDFVSSVGGGNIIGSAIGAVGSLLGKGGPDYGALAAQQYANQKEFAQNGVRWKVADAKAAGIHPLAALGAQTFSYSPVMAGDAPDNRVGDALKQMGQGISRAAEAKQLAEERALNAQLVQANINKTNAETDYVRQQAARAEQAVKNTAAPPPMPWVNAGLKTGSQGNLGPVQITPPEVSTANPEKYHQAGTNPDLQWMTDSRGWVHAAQSDKAKTANEEDMVATFLWNLRNRFQPTFDLWTTGKTQDYYKPPKNMLPKGYSDWEHMGGGSWRPVR